MSRQRHHPDDDDIAAFRQALRETGVRRIEHNCADPGRPRRSTAAAAERRAAAQQHAPSSSTGYTSDGRVEPVHPSEFLDFALPDLPWRTRQQLKRGRIAWEEGLDLHGYTLDQARTELEHFLVDAVAARHRCVLVVHGKSWGSSDYPVIKSHVNIWLREWPAVLAFCSATDTDGGTGALYVLLQRKNRQS